MIKLMTFFFCLLATTAKAGKIPHVGKDIHFRSLKGPLYRPPSYQFLSSSTFMKLVLYYSFHYYFYVLCSCLLLHCILVVATEQLSTLTFTHGTFVDECILRD